MSYRDDLREMIYISPSGKQFTLYFDELVRSGGKKAPSSEYPGQNEGSVQDLGATTQTFNITCYISGSNYHTEADRFYEALSESGPATLRHPRWGDLPVLPTTKEQRENFVNGAGRAVFSIAFIHAKNAVLQFPTIAAAPGLKALGEVEAADEATLAQFEDETISDPRDITGLTASVSTVLSTIPDAFDRVIAVVNGLSEDLDDATGEITRTIDSLVSAPADLMTSLLTLYKLPADVEATISSKVDGYASLYDDLADAFVEQSTNYSEVLGLISVSQASAIQTAAAQATVTGDITTRGEAARIIAALHDLNQTINSGIEVMEDAGGFSIPYELKRSVNAAVTTAISNLITRSLTLPMERVITLTEDTSPLVLVWEQYGDLDRLEEFIEYNALEDSEFLMIPRGREVVVYE